jgi:hypothetical protein
MCRPGPADQVNLTDEESRLIPTAAGGLEQCDTAQAVVAADSLLVVAGDVVQAPNGKQQVQPMLGELAALSGELGEAEILLADTGYFSEANVDACAAAGIDPLIAQGRQSHYPPLSEPTAADPPAPENPASAEASVDQSREGPQCVAQTDTQTGVRRHQIGDGLPAILAAWPRESSE